MINRNEDFPALPGSTMPKRQVSSQTQNLNQQRQRQSATTVPTAAPTTASSIHAPGPSAAPIGGQIKGRPVSTASSGVSSQIGSAANASIGGPISGLGSLSSSINPQSDLDRFGMNGLLSVVMMEQNDQNSVAIGSDLPALGVSGIPPDGMASKAFASPWLETSKSRVEPEFKLPKCYEVPSAVPQQQKIQNLSDETLFYIFYLMPRDSMQEAAAAELTNRNWRYHKELKLWLTKDPLSEPIQQTSQAERGIYIFFDATKWEKIKKEYVLYYPAIA